MATTALPGILARHSIFALWPEPVNFKLLLHVSCGSLYHGDTNEVIFDAEGAHEGQYGCTRGLIWVHARDDMGLSDRVMGFES